MFSRLCADFIVNVEVWENIEIERFRRELVKERSRKWGDVRLRVDTEELRTHRENREKIKLDDITLSDIVTCVCDTGVTR